MIFHNLLIVLSGLLSGCVLAALFLRVLPRPACRNLGLLLLLPTLGTAFMLPAFHKAIISGSYLPFWQGVLLATAIVFPIGNAVLRRPSDLTRAAIGLGADTTARLRLIWLPLLLPSILFSSLLAAVLSFTCAALDLS